MPALLQMQVEYLEGRGDMLAQDLRLIFMSGDWIPVALPERIPLSLTLKNSSLAALRGLHLVNHGAGFKKVDPWDEYSVWMAERRRALQGLERRRRRSWAPRVSGQLFIGGVGLAKGYWRDGNSRQLHHPPKHGSASDDCDVDAPTEHRVSG